MASSPASPGAADSSGLPQPPRVVEMDRVVKSVTPPPMFPMTEAELFSGPLDPTLLPGASPAFSAPSAATGSQSAQPPPPAAAAILSPNALPGDLQAPIPAAPAPVDPGADLDHRYRLPNLELLRAHLEREGRLDKPAALRLIRQARALLQREPNVLQVAYPVTVVGDLHGQFFDMLQMFEVGGDPASTQYLFLGDYVDRGCFSTEVVLMLYALKIARPSSVWMLRGNHECRALTAFFNFKDECLYKYDLEVYDVVMDSFDALPLAAVINKAFFCVHGGLSPEIRTLADIQRLHRFQEIPRSGPLCDLLWSDPFDEEAGEDGLEVADDGLPPSAGGASPSSSTGSKQSQSRRRKPVLWFEHNRTRQCSYMYGLEAVRQFLDRNNLVSIIRAHEAQVDGYKMQLVNPETGIPRVITVFSAPNYCDVYKNKAACLKFDYKVLNIKQYLETEHPYYLPNFMDVFEWSLPFVAEKVTDMLASILEAELKPSPEQLEQLEQLHQEHNQLKQQKLQQAAQQQKRQEQQQQQQQQPAPPPPATILKSKGPLFKKKVLAVTRLLRMYRTLRQDHESILQLKQLTPDNQIPRGLLGKGSAEIRKAINGYQQAKAADQDNERMPPPSPELGPAVAAVISGSSPVPAVDASDDHPLMLDDPEYHQEQVAADRQQQQQQQQQKFPPVAPQLVLDHVDHKSVAADADREEPDDALELAQVNSRDLQA